VLLTVEGQSGWGRLTETAARNHVDIEAWRRELEAKGIVFVRDDFFVGSTHPDFYHSTFHASWYVFEHWSRFFDIAAYLPDGSISQDLIVLRRRAGESPPAAVPPPRRARQQGAPTAASLVRRAVRRARQELEQRRPGRADQLARELSILRAGLYEQGNRISVIASELRAELDALRRENASARDD
jgi:hypothetical protein